MTGVRIHVAVIGRKARILGGSGSLVASLERYSDAELKPYLLVNLLYSYEQLPTAILRGDLRRDVR